MRDRVRACVLALVCRGWVGAGQAGKGGAITQVWIMSKRCNVFRGFQPKYCMLITLWYAGLLIRDEILKNLTPKSVVCSTKYHNFSCTYKPTTHEQSAKNLMQILTKYQPHPLSVTPKINLNYLGTSKTQIFLTYKEGNLVITQANPYITLR